MTFDSTNFEAIIKLADDIFATSAPLAASQSVSAIRQSLDETLPAIPYPQPEVTALQRGGGRGRGGYRGGRGNRGGRGGRGGGGGSPPNSGSNQNSSSQNSQSDKPKGAKHPNLPPGEWKGCRMHYTHWKNAYFCAAPATCPWKDIFAPRPNK